MKFMRAFLSVVCLLVMFTTANSLAQDEGTRFTPSIWGIELPVTDVERAVEYYTEVLGFRVVQQPSADQRVVLDNDGLKLVFHLVKETSPGDGEAHLILNLRVSDLEGAAQAALAADGVILSSEPITAAIGVFIPIHDPFGNSVHLIDLTGEEEDPEGLPRLYNVGFTNLDLERTEAFYMKLGFEVYSRDYLPDALPLKPVGAAMLVLHPMAAKKANHDSHGATLLLDCEDLKSAEQTLRQSHFASQGSDPPGRDDEQTLIMHDPSGNRIQIVNPATMLQVSSARSEMTAGKRTIDSEMAAQLFEKFKSLKGTWMGHSSKGWNDLQIFEVIGNKSVVMQRSEFKDDPDSTMITMYHLDGGRLMLTHYCEARNQPRMVATSIDNEGRVTFTYLDGTGLPSRDTGHMDSAEFQFIDDDHFTDRWTWYAKGESAWMETVTNERIPKAGVTTAPDR